MSYQYAEQLRQAIANAGLTPPDNLIADGEIHRFSKDGKRGDDSGWYVYFADGRGATFGCWSTGLREHWRADIGREWSAAEIAEYKRQADEAQAKRQAAKEQAQNSAKAMSAARWALATPADPAHPYLQAKGIQPHGLREVPLHGGGTALIVPMFADGELWSLQSIFPDGQKFFEKGGRVSGCYSSIGVTDGADVVCIAEGSATAATVHEATGFPAYCAFNAGNLLKVAISVREMHPDARIIVAGDDDWHTDGNVGREKASEAALVVGGDAVFPLFGDDRGEKETDFNDMHARYGLEAVRAVFDGLRKLSDSADGDAGGAIDVHIEPLGEYSDAVEPNASTNPLKLSKAATDALMQRLAGMSPLEYDREREEAAKLLSVRTSTLDKEVGRLRKDADSTDGIGFVEVEPWHEQVNLAELLDNIAATIRRFIVCDKATADAAALWVLMTWVIDVVQVAPLAVISAPEKRCGKSQLLNLLGKLVYRPLQASNISAAALYRVIEGHQPTMMIDEADSFMRDNEDMRNIINSGHTRDSAYVIRTVGDDHNPTKFSTWGAKALSGIGKLADTIMDRSITLQLRRKLPHEKSDRLRYAEAGLFDELQSQIRRAVDDNREAIRRCRPDLPGKLNDRAQDNWEPLLAIADVAGGSWPEKARNAALTLAGEGEATRTVGNELLADIKEIFEAKNLLRIPSHDLLERLCADDEKPWATYNRGFPIKNHQLARRLAEYGIKSGTIRLDTTTTAKGYKVEQFKEAFACYLPPEAEQGGGVCDGGNVTM